MLEFIRQGNDGLLALADALEQNEKTGAVKAKPLDTIRIMAPIPHMERNIFCIGKNYTEHIAEFDKTAMPKPPKYPVIFTKLRRRSSARMTSSTPIRTSHLKSTMKANWPSSSARKVRTSPSAKHGPRLRFHYPQRRHGPGPAGQPRPVVPRQELDTFCPIGPYILLRDAAPDTFDIVTKVNNEVRQDGSTGEFIFTILN